MRENAGFKILGSLKVSQSMEIVIGRRDSDGMWVCWYYDIPGEYYSGGCYTSSYKEAHRVFAERTKTTSL